MLTKIINTSFVLIIIFVSCTKSEVSENNFSEAAYKVTLTGKWKQPEFSLPANAHFTPIIGMLHNANTNFFSPGMPASIGVERIAEDGNSFPMLAAIDSVIGIKQALSDFIIFSPSITEGVTGVFATNSNYSLFSFESMIAPTPDWFIGLHDFNLMPAGKWITDTTVNIYVYDAGTEEGDRFDMTNPDSSPRMPVTLLTPSKATVLANGNTILAPMATLRLQKL